MTSSKRSFVSLCLVLDEIGPESSNLGRDLPVIQRFRTFAQFFLCNVHRRLRSQIVVQRGHNLGGQTVRRNFPVSARVDLRQLARDTIPPQCRVDQIALSFGESNVLK